MNIFKTAIILSLNNSNVYLNEWIEYYKKLQFTNVILIDNSTCENVFDIISKDDKFIIYEDYKNKLFNHTYFVKEIFCKYYDQFDYIAIFDIDEFLFINQKYNNNINIYLNESFCKENDEILIHWKTYTSNNLTYYEDKPVIERFTEESSWGTWEIKSIINCNNIKNKLSKTEIYDSIFEHGIDNAKLICCLNNGKLINKFSPVIFETNYECAMLKHYIIKSLQEFVDKIKLNKLNNYSPNANLWKFYLYNNKNFSEDQLKYLTNIL